MIRTKEDLSFYLKEDAKCYSLRMPYWLGLIIGNEPCHALRMMRVLRKYEYAINNASGIIGKLRLAYRSLIFRKLSFKYKIFLSPNTIGYGFHIVHFGGGVIVNCNSMGNYCVITSGVVVGNKGSKDNRPTIGDRVSMTLGCKIIGKIVIGNNVIVAPNSVVVKDVPDNAVVSGIPAKLLKIKESESI